MKAYLIPEPCSDESGEWKSVERKFAVTSEDEAQKLVTLMQSSEDFSEECKLLVILAFQNSCLETSSKSSKKAFKKLFNFKDVRVAEKTGASILEQWRQNAKAALEQLAPKQKTTEDWFSDVCAYKLVIAHINFIKSCGIQGKKMFDVLESKYFLGWNQPGYLNDVSD